MNRYSNAAIHEYERQTGKQPQVGTCKGFLEIGKKKRKVSKKKKNEK